MEKDINEPIKSMLNRAYNQALEDIKNKLCQDDEDYFYPCICPGYLEEIINGLKK